MDDLTVAGLIGRLTLFPQDAPVRVQVGDDKFLKLADVFTQGDDDTAAVVLATDDGE